MARIESARDTSIGPNELRRLLRGPRHPVLIDVRSREDFGAATLRIPGSLNIPADELPGRLAELTPMKDQVLVTLCMAGRKAGNAAELLRQSGFAGARALVGGLRAWQQAPDGAEESARSR